MGVKVCLILFDYRKMRFERSFYGKHGSWTKLEDAISRCVQLFSVQRRLKGIILSLQRDIKI